MRFFWQDFRYGLRNLRRNPGFCAVAVLALALGIGPNTAIFTMVNAVLLRPLPLAEPDRVVMIWGTMLKSGFDQLPVSAADYLEYKAQAKSFDQMAAAFAIPEYGLNVSGGGAEPERVAAATCSKEFLPALGIKPVVGRNFLPEEDLPGGAPVVLISNAFWQRRFHADAEAVGKKLTVDGVPRTVVGVAPNELGDVVAADLWLPTAINPNQRDRRNHNFGIVAHLKPGVSIEQARAEMKVIAERLERAYPENQGWGTTVFPLAEMFAGRVRPVLVVLLGAVGLLLLIACANLANLLLARAATREKEIAVRCAIGAGRARIIAQLLTENLALAVAGGVLGLALAVWCVNALRAVVPDMFPLLQHMSVNGPVLAFTLGLSLATGLLFGLVPAWKAARIDLNTTLKESAGRSESAGGQQRIRGALLGFEVALAVLLAVSAGLLLRSFRRVVAVDPGVRTKGVLTMTLSLPDVKYDTDVKRGNFYRDLIERVQSVPGVKGAGAVLFLPLRVSILSFRVGVHSFRVEGQPADANGRDPVADFRMATPGYFDAVGIGLRRGRLFDGHDDLDSKRVAIVNEAMVRKHFPDGRPLGRRLEMGKYKWEIVGVVADAKLYGLDSPTEPALYVPHRQSPWGSMGLVVRTDGDAAAVTAAVRREILKMDPEQPISNVRTMEKVLSDSLMLRRTAMTMLAVFAGLALSLAMVGVYGLTAYSVSRRTHEIGLRVALGASRGQVVRLVSWRTLAIAVAGAAIGEAAALELTRLLAGMLYGVSVRDPLVFVGAPAVLVAVALAASWLPAWRATRVDPVRALRWE